MSPYVVNIIQSRRRKQSKPTKNKYDENDYKQSGEYRRDVSAWGKSMANIKASFQSTGLCMRPTPFYRLVKELSKEEEKKVSNLKTISSQLTNKLPFQIFLPIN